MPIAGHLSLYQHSMEIQLGDIGHIIQLAVAPVFLLTGVGTNLLELTNRLARIIVWSRVLEIRIDTLGEPIQSGVLDEISVLFSRAHLGGRAGARGAGGAGRGG